MGESYTLGVSIMIFIIITLFYFTLKVYFSTAPEEEEGGISSAIKGLYFLIILISQYIWNFSNATAICGTSQSYLNVLLYTLLPNFFIFATIVVIIAVLPGWLSPFSNTLGYGFVYCMGLTKTFNELLDPKGNALITKICSDVSILINEMTIENYVVFMKELGPASNKAILKANYDKGENKKAFDRLFFLVSLKQSIAEMLWYLFAGCLVISISYNSIQDMTCSFTTDQMRDIHNEMKKNSATESGQKKAPVLYTKHN